MARVTRTKVLNVAKFEAVLFALFGIVAGILYSFGGLIIDVLVSVGWVSSTSTPGLGFGTALAFGALLAMPVIFLISVSLMRIIGAFLYSMVAQRLVE